MRIEAYRRKNGAIGIRNQVAVIPTSVCASEVAVRISAAVPGTVALPHQHGCCQVGADFDQTLRALGGLGANPNVAAVLVVTLGCEGLEAHRLIECIARSDKPVESVNIQNVGGSEAALTKGVAQLQRLMAHSQGQSRTAASLSEIILATECGGSDATSGLVANPVLGLVSDRLLEKGGTSILSETTELIGAEHILAQRTRTPAVKDHLLSIVARMENRALAMGVDIRGTQPTPGNIAGGITTIEEKSLGCIHKAGSALIEAVLEYAECPQGKGLFVMDTPGHDIESVTGMVAGGAQVVIFTTGRGTPTGCPIAPVIKVTGNSATYGRMTGNIDINAGVAIDQGIDIHTIAADLLEELVAVCNGKTTKAENLGHREMAIFRVGQTF
jgi:altronate dehydratase large subunit